ncbi:MAG TPA: hypothetical protein VHB68_05045 [Steroidobacteraceae bacterium]|nr:hypothetical protein [Steroidobacteraceae bacterium]
MRRALRVTVAILGVMAPCAAVADSSLASDRISVTGNGSTLTGTSGGGGGALAWLHNFDPDALVTLGAEHQKLGDAQWTFGTLLGSLSREIGTGRYSFYAEGHEGAGDDGPHPLKYHIEAAGVAATYFHKLSLLVEARRIDVETTHGNLPKVAVSYLWTPHWLTTVSYADSAGGNLGTQLTSVRVDRYSSTVNLLAGGSYGRASPTIIALGIVSPGHILREGYAGVSKTLARRTDVSLTADYLNLSGSKRATLTLSFMFRLGSLGARR